jgi:hypothetical protein
MGPTVAGALPDRIRHTAELDFPRPAEPGSAARPMTRRHAAPTFERTVISPRRNDMQIRPLIRRCGAGALVFAAATCSAAAASPTASPAPIVTATLTKHGPAIVGPRTWRPGAARIAVVSKVDDEELTLMHFRPGYTYARFLADGSRAQGHTAAARTALRRIFAETIFDGGVDLFAGQSADFTVSVHLGTYYLGEMSGRPQFTPIRVAGGRAVAAPASAATITETDAGYRISARALPASGTITIRNAGERSHRFNLIPVKPGTTRAQLGAYLRKTGAADNAPPPSFALHGAQLGTADLCAHQQMQLAYTLPAGEYALIDFDHDMTTGRPQALEGMYAITTLR